MPGYISIIFNKFYHLKIKMLTINLYIQYANVPVVYLKEKSYMAIYKWLNLQTTINLKLEN